MKMMFQTFVDISVDLMTILKENCNTKKPVNIKDVLERYTVDVIASCAFGIDSNALTNPNSDFLKIGRTMIKSMNFRLAATYVIPKSILQLFRVRLMSKFAEDYFRSIVKQTIEYRENNNINRKDIIQSLIQIKNGINIKDDDNIGAGKDSVTQRLTLNQIAAECYVFFIAGFETSSTTMTMAFLELALNPKIQNRLRQEIITCLQETDGKITYEAIMKMEYLDQVINGKFNLSYSFRSNFNLNSRKEIHK